MVSFAFNLTSKTTVQPILKRNEGNVQYKTNSDSQNERNVDFDPYCKRAKRKRKYRMKEKSQEIRRAFKKYTDGFPYDRRNAEIYRQM